MSDGGGEYQSRAYDEMLREKGIKILKSAPHTPQQNGRAEHCIRTLTEKSETMRLDACITPSWWEFSFEHACHVYNRTPNHRLRWRTPYEILNGKKPELDHLRIFGCGAYVHLHKDIHKNKMSPKSELMIYLGVPNGEHGFKFMRLQRNSIFVGLLWFSVLRA